MKIENERLIRQNECINRTGLSRSTIWRMEKEDKFPKRIRVGKRIVAWKMSSVQNWIDNQIG